MCPALVDSFDQMANTLVEQLAELKSIVLETMEQSKNLSAIEGDLVDVPRLELSVDEMHDWEREWHQCCRIASFQDICSLQLTL